ncbi:MAG TPA: hypothetical protein VIP05_26345 [Burkholderiaceae bacterium]
MFGFKKKEIAPVVETKVEEAKSNLPEGFELLSECEFAEVSGGTTSPGLRYNQL